MPIFTWSDEIATGIDVIDTQHKKLIDLVNELNDAMMARKAKEILEKILQDLTDYTVYHFSMEERAFERYGYSKKDDHLKYHRDFVAKVQDLTKRFKNSEIALSIDVMQFLVDWVKHHILVEDKKYVSELRGKDFA